MFFEDVEYVVILVFCDVFIMCVVVVVVVDLFVL